MKKCLVLWRVKWVALHFRFASNRISCIFNLSMLTFTCEVPFAGTSVYIWVGNSWAYTYVFLALWPWAGGARCFAAKLLHSHTLSPTKQSVYKPVGSTSTYPTSSGAEIETFPLGLSTLYLTTVVIRAKRYRTDCLVARNSSIFQE